MGFANKPRGSVSEWILRAAHESRIENVPSRHVFEKKSDEIHKNCTLPFLKNCNAES